MSLDDRCQQFHEAALGTGKSKAPPKEIATLRKFLHKNQDQRFSDKATARLFDTIQVYVVQKASEEVSVDLKEGLLEDSLKMPFTVFSTKQKQKMIKWLEDLRGGGGGISGSGGKGGHNTAKNLCVLSVIDLEGTTMTLMSDETGDTYENIELGEDVGAGIRKAFESTDGVVSVEATIDEGSNIIKQIIRLVEDPKS
mmetsp:Transcript_18141/g.43875  ORF Transcript_18141/g.43875 Transcript_18141/m.43875 type:complete len:197 (-) Transcript_18141:37-627(-)